VSEKYAFPCGTEHLAEPVTAGMTLKDYFAAKAMQGLLASPLTTSSVQMLADDCYIIADAMLKAREK
jgi:hypothetical protein